MDNKNWKQHAESGYFVSDHGDVLNRGKEVKHTIANGGRSRTISYWDCKDQRQRSKSVPALMLEAFVGRPSKKAHAALIDGDPNNMTLDNLHWIHVGEAKSKLRPTLQVSFRDELAEKLTAMADVQHMRPVDFVKDLVESVL